MTAHRDPWLICDGSDQDHTVTESQFPEDAGESAFVDATIPELRAAARDYHGWSFVIRNGRGFDLCPSCTEKGKHA